MLWDQVIEKVEKKLSTSKKHYLSVRERITLIKACMANISVYNMSLFKMPKVVRPRLDRIRRNFLSEGQSDKKEDSPYEMELGYQAEKGRDLETLKIRVGLH